MRPAAALVLCLCLSAAPVPRSGNPGGGGPPLRRYDTPYYVVHTDLPPEGAAEAVVRMAALGDELRRRTRDLGFNGRIEQRLPFYLYARHGDYLAATGAPPRSAGVFLGDRLVAAAADARGAAAWHVVQHEAFHQFPDAATGTEPPAWLNEGLGEYFGEALFTGDGYVTGVVPAWRLKRVRRAIEGNTFQPLADFARLSQDNWNQGMTLARYDQAWSAIQFLLHGDRRNHRDRLVDYVRALCAGDEAQAAWDRSIGKTPNLEQSWKQYWLDLPDSGTPDVHFEATVATFTSFLARSAMAGQSFNSFQAFTRAARDGTLRSGREDWLPPSLIQRTLESLPQGARFSIEGKGPDVRLTAWAPGAGAWSGSFQLLDGRVAAVMVTRAQLASPEPETLEPWNPKP